MRPFSKRVRDYSKLRLVLVRINQLLENSVESVWTPWTPNEVVTIIETSLISIDRGESPDIEALRLHFAPTGSIQEIAMSNNWSEEYLKLAAHLDEQLK